MTRASLLRLTAILLLLLAGTELFACEVLAPEQCESFGFPTDQSSQEADDDCICCCSHVLVVDPPQPFAVAESPGEFAPLSRAAVEREAPPVYHPPRV